MLAAFSRTPRFGADALSAAPVFLNPLASLEDEEAGAACCRVCLCDVTDGPLFRLQCKCRGAMGLVHQVCADTWFASRRSGVCEVCRELAWRISSAALEAAVAKEAVERAAAVRERANLAVQAPVQLFESSRQGGSWTLFCFIIICALAAEASYQAIVGSAELNARTYFSLFFCCSLSFFVVTSLGRARIMAALPALQTRSGRSVLTVATALCCGAWGSCTYVLSRHS